MLICIVKYEAGNFKGKLNLVVDNKDTDQDIIEQAVNFLKRFGPLPSEGTTFKIEKKA